MELYIKDRIYIPQLLPNNTKWAEYNLKQSIIKKISISDNDIEEYEIVQDEKNNRITWNPQKDHDLPLMVEFSAEELSFMKASCEGMADKELPDDFWSVVQKIYDSE